MNKKLDNLLLSLDDEIEKKCFEIKQKKKEKALKQFFMITCALFIVVPIVLVFMGVNLLLLFIWSSLFLTISLFILFPLLLNNNPEGLTL